MRAWQAANIAIAETSTNIGATNECGEAMSERFVERRLAAILAADVAGYTRLMEDDTDGTVAAWQDAREDVIKPAVASHSGKIVKLTGDGFLVEFPTVQDAVNCAIAMQGGLAASSLDFRMGVNLGDIVDDGEDIHGEGVNVAARLEGLAEPGGICISGDVYNQVRNRIDADYKDMGAQDVKNVSAPVQAYAIRVQDSPAAVAGAAAEKPSIAVLPFDNISGDPEQEYFSDGITEDIITALSQIRWFLVIARNSTFSYKGQSPDVRRVAQELGVRYVLEGSVRKAGNRVRITAQLIDANTGSHIWAEKYDRELEDIFAVQDEITNTVVTAIEPELSRAEQERARRKPPGDMDAWDCYQRGMWHLGRTKREANEEAQGLFQRAVEIDPNFSDGYSGLAVALMRYLIQGWTDRRDETIEKSRQAATTALALNDSDANAYVAIGMAGITKGDYEMAEDATTKAININPNNAFAHMAMGMVYAHSGRAEEAFPELDHMERLNPRDPLLFMVYNGRAIANVTLGNYDEALSWSRKAIQHPNTIVNCHLMHIIVLVKLERSDEARAAVEELFRIRPGFTMRGATNAPGAVGDYLECLREAGIPEE